MITSRLKYCLLFLSFSIIYGFAQDSLSYRVEGLATFGSGEYTPFWMVSNTYGKVPLQNNSGYLDAEIVWKHSFSKDLNLETGIEATVATQHVSSVWLQQIYTDISFRKIKLSIGVKERYNSMLDRKLSMGDFNYSANARPIPEINFSFPEYTIVPFTKDILKFKADFAFGKSFENNYISETKQESANYAKDILWHHKSLFFLLDDPNEQFPGFFIFGFDHGVQWGGWTSHKNFGNLPNSFKDFIRIVLGKSGAENAIDMDQVNVLGNHQGTYNLKLGYKHEYLKFAAYKQHYFDDNSGMEYSNWRDGIWGLEIDFFSQPYLKKILVEYLQTTNQSGPMHFLHYDDKHDARGGGNDDYYNHELYFQGWSYFGRAVGNPLITSPEYNKDNALYFKNNRLKAIHLGIHGSITSEIDYRTLFTGMQSWGRMLKPFLKRKDNFSALLECNYKPQKLQGWNFGIQLSVDKGDLYGDNLGILFKIVRKDMFPLK